MKQNPPEQDKDEREEETYPFWPDHFVIELIIAYILLLGLIVLSSLLPTELGEQANPLATPEHIKPEWYFLSVYQLLKLVPRTIGILLPLAGVIVLLFLPFIDRNPARRASRRVFGLMLMAIILIVTIALTAWGLVS